MFSNAVVNLKKFEDKYEILNSELSYLNHPRYKDFVNYLVESNKIAVIFTSNSDGYFIIENHPLILKYNYNSKEDIKKFIDNLKFDYESYEADYTIVNDYKLLG